MISRRGFLKATSIVPFLKTAPALGASNTKVPLLQTLTTKTTAQLIVLRRRGRQFKYSYDVPAGRETIALKPVREFEYAGSDWSVDWLLATGLTPGERYYFNVTENGTTLDRREFSSLDLAKPNPRIMIASCMHDNRVLSQKLMWRRVQKTKPDLMFWVGDCLYGDYKSDGSMAGLHDRHCQVRRQFEIFYAPTLIPALATWDQHDFGVDATGGADFPFKKERHEIFWMFFGSDHFNHPERMAHFSKGPGNSSALTAFGQNFMLMDDRTWRNKPGGGRHWGDEQEAWLYSYIKANQNTSWLMNGSQFFGEYRKLSESFERDQPQDFKRVLGELAKLPAKVLFVSGDIHMSEVMRIEKEILGYESYELTSSSIHSFSFPGNELLGKATRRITYANWLNFFIVDLSREGAVTELDLTSVGRFFNHFNLKLKI